ncbi:large subunit ribosomal protein L22, partial [Tremellales sp. Uapishka_1]
MARPFRSSLLLAQSIAGPSRPAAVQSRSLFNFNVPISLPSWPRLKKSGETSSTPSPSTSVPSTTPEPLAVTDSIFSELEGQSAKPKKWKEHRYSTATHKASHRKLNLLARQIAGQPIDEAIVQMEFSEKRAAERIKSTLCLARDHAIDKGLNRSKLVVAESWVSKGPKIARVDIKGRGRLGIKHHPTARLHLLLKEGKTRDELSNLKREKVLDKVRSAGVVREGGVLRRKVVSGWTW